MRVSLNRTTVSYLEAEMEHFRTGDINEVIQGICIERRQLLLMLQVTTTMTTTLTSNPLSATSAPTPVPSSITLDSLAGLLDS